MTVNKEFIKCPKCKHKIKIKIITNITHDEINSIIDRSLFEVKCKECNETIVALYPLIIETENYIIHFDPSYDKSIVKDKIKNKTKRLCLDYDDLKEKILIFEDNLNDVIIEFIKEFYKHQLDKETKKKLNDIRYNSIVDNNIVLSLIGVNKNIACPLEVYKELEKRCKIKSIKNAIIIDETSYRKYFKMR